MVCTGSTVIWEPKESTLEKKFQRAVTVYKDCGLNVNLDQCLVMKISWKIVGMEEIKCSNHEIKKVDSFQYL
jgi:hypothetical protein